MSPIRNQHSTPNPPPPRLSNLSILIPRHLPPLTAFAPELGRLTAARRFEKFTQPFIFRAHGYTFPASTVHVMASRRKRSNVHQSKANPRATFKLFGQAPMQATILSRNRAGFWIQGGKLAEFLGGCDCSGVEVDVCFLSANKVEWYKAPSANSHSTDAGK